MLTLQIIADIIQKGMNLDSSRIWIYNTRREIPVDKGLYVIVGNLSVKPFGVNRSNDLVTGGLTEHLTQQFQENIYIEIFSSDTSAMLRLPELIGSLNSTYSEQQQEKLGLRIASVPVTINDISSLEGTTILYRFNITYNVIRA
jgi:hypothetical protein